MHKISSEGTFFLKRIFPSLYFGFLTFFLILVIFGTSNHSAQSLFLLITTPALMMFVGFMIFKATVFSVADEVFDCGDYLLVRQDSREVQVSFENIHTINYFSGRQLRLVILLQEECQFGKKITFYPAGLRRLGSPTNPTGNLIADGLLARQFQQRD